MAPSTCYDVLAFREGPNTVPSPTSHSVMRTPSGHLLMPSMMLSPAESNASVFSPPGSAATPAVMGSAQRYDAAGADRSNVMDDEDFEHVSPGGTNI